jgi:microcystin-dependent protein
MSSTEGNGNGNGNGDGDRGGRHRGFHQPKQDDSTYDSTATGLGTAPTWLSGRGPKGGGGGLRGPAGPAGPAGPSGPQGAPGQGVPAGGTTGQSLTKTSAADYATAWTTVTGGGGTANIDYVGAYDNARVYHDGEYVVGADGITYQCVVEGTTGVTPTPWSSVAVGSGVPTGTGIDWFTTTPPSGFLLCDGSAVGRSAFPALWSVLGTVWGAGDGSTTFNLPDCRGRVLVGYMPGGNSEVATIGASDGTAAASRRVRHAHSSGLSLTGAPGLGSLQLPNHAHAITSDSAVKIMPPGSGGANLTQSAEHSDLNVASMSVGGVTSNPAILGAPSVGSLGISGSIGVTGGTADGPSFVVATKAIKT